MIRVLPGLYPMQSRFDGFSAKPGNLRPENSKLGTPCSVFYRVLYGFKNGFQSAGL